MALAGGSVGGVDPFSVTGRTLPLAERVQLLVVGAGPAGLAAACEAARAGVQVMLVDENPVPPETMGDDIPLMFGQRMSGAVRNVTAMTEALVASEPLFEPAFEAGVDVRLGTVAWGLFANNAAVGWLPGPVAGLSGPEGASLVGFEHVIVAAGHRDMGLAFPGWELPGVMGAAAAMRLVRCGALAARRAVVVGSTAEALATALALQHAGVAVVGVLEQAPAPVAPPAQVEQLAKSGIALLRGHRVVGAKGQDEVVALTVCDAEGALSDLACDTVVLGVGAVPVVELLDAVGCAIDFAPQRGGFVPRLGAGQTTTLGIVHAVGDCAGTWPAKTLDRRIAEAEGRSAAAAVAQALGLAHAAPDHPMSPPDGFNAAAYRLAWVRGTVLDGTDDVHVCRCEEVTARDVLEVRPPRYLDWPRPPVTAGSNAPSLASLIGDGPPDPDQIKRLTRAGMGICQGRRCREQVAGLLALGAHVDPSQIRLASHRAPVRPLPLAQAGAVGMGPAMAEHWDTWFGMASQIVPYWETSGDE